MANGFGFAALQSIVALSGLGTIANNATGISAAFTVPLVANSAAGICYIGDFQANITSATSGSGTPVIQAVFITKTDGTNFDPYGTNNNQLFPFDYSFFRIPLIPSTAYTILKAKGIVIPAVPSGSNNIEIVLYNLSGVSITVNSAGLYPTGVSS